MIEIEVKDGWYIITAPKLRLVMTKAQFIEALKRGKAFRRRAALTQRLEEAARQPSPHV